MMRYWNDIKKQLSYEGSELSEKIGQLKLKSRKDDKYYLTDVLDTEGIFRLIESIILPTNNLNYQYVDNKEIEYNNEKD